MNFGHSQLGAAADTQAPGALRMGGDCDIQLQVKGLEGQVQKKEAETLFF